MQLGVDHINLADTIHNVLFIITKGDILWEGKYVYIF